MDPNATLREMLDAFEANDLESARESAGHLLEWLDKGGYPPRAHTRDTAFAIAHAIANGTVKPKPAAQDEDEEETQ